jgi:hypothetical protein
MRLGVRYGRGSKMGSCTHGGPFLVEERGRLDRVSRGCRARARSEIDPGRINSTPAPPFAVETRMTWELRRGPARGPYRCIVG